MQPLVNQLQQRFPSINFAIGERFYWSPETTEVYYPEDQQDKNAIWALLHETSHALLKHQNYSNDFELIEMELAAWERAKQLATQFGIPLINDDHIQDCLDTYRDWLHRRCLCPRCGNRSFQNGGRSYACHNCGASWRVTASRFCRSYRLMETESGSIKH